ncbi:hypothetical protein ACW9HR_26790 [Nocardia gipuzkoensis]
MLITPGQAGDSPQMTAVLDAIEVPKCEGGGRGLAVGLAVFGAEPGGVELRESRLVAVFMLVRLSIQASRRFATTRSHQSGIP